jgi:murein DD-endopeptidase MepM/ murein hydrolase activator NlpD
MQDRLVKAVLGSYVSKYGYRGAASAWYSGQPQLENNYNPQKFGPSVGDYVDSVMKKVGSSGFSGAMTGIADQAIMAATKAARATPGFKADPLEVGQGLVPNQAAADRQENASVKGIGMSVADGSGQGQIGMEAGMGIDDTNPLGLTSALGGAGSSAAVDGAQTAGRSVIDGIGDVANKAAGAVANLGQNGFHYFNPVPGFKPSGTWGSYPGSGKQHMALDFAVPLNTAVRAPIDGRVIFAGWDPNAAKTNGGFGLSLRIQNADGSYVILGHLSSIAGLKVGSTIKGGQVIARSGDTGNSTGPHLHMEFRHAAWDPSSAFNYTSLFKW